jgi:hypothetical protein
MTLNASLSYTPPDPNALKDFIPVNTGVFQYLQGKYRFQCYKHILHVFTGRLYRKNLQDNFSCNYRGFPVK